MYIFDVYPFQNQENIFEIFKVILLNAGESGKLVNLPNQDGETKVSS